VKNKNSQKGKGAVKGIHSCSGLRAELPTGKTSIREREGKHLKRSRNLLVGWGRVLGTKRDR